ncbi:MAG: signal transduction histidine kinase [Nitrososphaeraceae archaeon]|nr:signal transduction histidine kinase [Nitrososphaeraceae archaeon]
MIKDGDFFSKKRKEIGVISVVAIIISSFGLFFYQQNLTEQNVKNSIFSQYKDRQIESTKMISQYINSDLQLLMSILQGIADSSLLQQGLLSGDRIDKMMRDRFLQVNNVTKIDTIFIADKDDIVTYEIVSEGTRSFVNLDLSFREYVQEVKNTRKPVFSNGFKGIDNIYRIALAVPIINSSSGEYVGLVAVKIPTESFFSLYGNIQDINSQFLVVYDRKGTLLAVGADKSLLGKNFFGEFVQNFTNHNPILLNLTQNLLQGISGYGIYNYGKGERITTNVPVFIQGKPLYFIQIVTPTATIYSEINNILFGEKLQMFSLIAGSISAISILIMFLIKWNSLLNNEVKKRTKELKESNRKLVLSNREIALANEELKVHDKMQKEFINIASHEIKTPIQAILTFSQLLQMYPERQKEFTQAINRNSIRLQRLSNDILDVAKIESGALTLNKELFNINEVISNIINDYRSLIVNKNYKVKLYFKPFKENLLIEADKERISEVISNLLSNAIKFTKEGEIFVSIEKKEDYKNNDNYALVTVRDTGEGVQPEILSKIFLKFITKSFEGLGLGLYISKNIVEAHGGKIWAENNIKDGNSGATFYFKLPLEKSNININNNFNRDK